MIQSKIISSLDKCFPASLPEDFTELKSLSALKGERISFQLIYMEDDNEKNHRVWCRPVIQGDISEYITVRIVDFIPSLMPAYPESDRSDDQYLTKKSGLFPDLLSPLSMKGNVPVCNFQARTLWFTAEIPENAEKGDHLLSILLSDSEGNTLSENKISIHIVDAVLPPQSMTVTQWFHCDCLAQYYHVPVFSEEHWNIIESFMRTAVKNGINTILTPVFTPPLDTAVGGERLTVQLVKVKADDGRYSFDYTLLDRWIDMCNRLGVKYFEISHFFTQWGAEHAPKIIAEVDGVSKRIFGWETNASDGEYPEFLHTFIPDFLRHMKARGDDRRCIFHISDEPGQHHLEQYGKSKAVVSNLLKDYKTIDALSNFEFWQKGIVSNPVVSTNHIKPFTDSKVPHLWAYYCCGQGVGVSNRFFAMPGARTRFIGTQFYKYNIEGFLQWGYNFYMNQYSYDTVNPYADSTGGYFVPSGDAYSVYPSEDGKALESMRIVQFYDALQDDRAMQLCEKLCGREQTVKAIEDICGEIVFDRCVCDSETMISIREKVNAMIEYALK